MGHCDCDEPEPFVEEISPSHFDGETHAKKCQKCWGLIRIL